MFYFDVLEDGFQLDGRRNADVDVSDGCIIGGVQARPSILGGVLKRAIDLIRSMGFFGIVFIRALCRYCSISTPIGNELMHW